MAEKKKSVVKKPRKARPDKHRIAYWTEGEGLVEIEKWLAAGLFDKQIAANMNITQKTLIEWKDKYPVFGNLFLIGRGAAVIKVVNAMVTSATGHYAKEQVVDNKGKKQIVNKYYPPNVAAAIFLAKNWAPHKYKDKWDVDMQVKQENPMSNLTTEELRKLAAAGDEVDN